MEVDSTRRVRHVGGHTRGSAHGARLLRGRLARSHIEHRRYPEAKGLTQFRRIEDVNMSVNKAGNKGRACAVDNREFGRCSDVTSDRTDHASRHGDLCLLQRLCTVEHTNVVHQKVVAHSLRLLRQASGQKPNEENEGHSSDPQLPLQHHRRRSKEITGVGPSKAPHNPRQEAWTRACLGPAACRRVHAVVRRPVCARRAARGEPEFRPRLGGSTGVGSSYQISTS
jgi:hypothetical protein